MFPTNFEESSAKNAAAPRGSGVEEFGAKNLDKKMILVEGVGKQSMQSSF